MARTTKRKVEPEETNIVIRVPTELKASVADLAKSRERSLSAEARLALRAWLDTEEEAA